ncbi:hypothetical protein COCOBI_18-3080 [Coccomyxa sp. Obi]|nr:hypothetical protein COCOBI_18-3080 [Coccomyxa sp. Obi]
MHFVQPKEIDISVRSESALAWVQTHWGQASKMRLTWWERDIPWVTARNAASMTSLEHLELRHLQEESPTTAMLLMWLLAQAPWLQLLYLKYPRAVVVPPIRNLRHLMMGSSTEFTPATAASIGELCNLQTLWLGMAQSDPGNACAELDLTSLPQLSDVCIDDIPLPLIALPRHCRLHLVKTINNMMELDTWCDIARHGQLHSIKRRFEGMVLSDDMPASVLELDCSVLNWWNIKALGHQLRPAVFHAQSYRCLTHLRLAGREIHIVLPPELPLQVIHVEAESLSIVCGNPQEQAKRLQQLKVRYCTLQGAGIFVLVSLMCGMGAVLRQADVREPEDYDGFLVSYRREPGVWKCPCGACLHCLHQV